MDRIKISPAVIRRLPKYLYYLNELEQKKIHKISSGELSEITGFTASQIRQDLNHFGGFGQQGYGYRVSELKKSIRKIIGLDKEYKVVIVGYGRIGKAVLRYEGFETKKFNVLAVFDLPENSGEQEGVEVKSVSELSDFLDENSVDILVLTTPKEASDEIIEIVRNKKIKGIWNFAPTAIDKSIEIPVENILLSESLYALIYYMGNPEQYK